MKLTQDAKIVLIAERCGWQRSPPKVYWPTPFWIDPKSKVLRVFSELPNYFSDLNAMHEADKVLTEGQMTTMSQYLHRRLGMLWGFSDASQRSEAFGLTLGLWKEGE